jgi:hypothetical protein
MQDLQYLVDLRFQAGEVASIDKLSELWEIEKAAYGEASFTWRVHHEIEKTIDEYLSKVSIDDKQPLFQSVNKAGTALSGRAPVRDIQRGRCLKAFPATAPTVESRCCHGGEDMRRVVK